ncbi:hypothetical protein NLU13_0926 [Sarocladium strictum]|uniref:Aminoglycoside phosphotransferase domain-containing protein n=1 Tax=Sarocladium strictum TaxID=5046 RepID=A0AA39LB96_SARSR|nr:hypothetical protein NLU13_0926 [Sarocladium strictum]
MSLKPRYMRMRQDDLAWEKGDKEAEMWERTLLKAQVYRDIGRFINQHRPGEPVELHKPIRGGYNIFFRLEYKDGSSAALRIPCKGIVKCPDEKIRYEVATMRYIAENTTIPVAKVHHYGTAAENPTGLGPFIIMDYTEHERTMSEALNDPVINSSESHVLDPNVRTEKLEVLYRQMANIILQLSTLTFDRIGSLVQGEDGGFHVSGRPLTMNMNSILEFTEAPPSLLPNRQYSTATEWYSALADMHLMQLVFQHNDAVEDEEDARDKYVARQLFRRLAAEGRLESDFDTNEDHQTGKEAAFRMFSEDLRPSNVLIDKELRVVGVIDWEFAYIAPSQFSFDPPWWLLLKAPDEWSDGGYISWMETYGPRLETFLLLLEEEEQKAQAAAGSTSADQGGVRLSQQMRKRWESRAWMINYAARNSWAFDYIYWKFLDAEFFGHNENGDHHERLGMLTKAEVKNMEQFVRMKMQEHSERALAEWNDESAATRLAKFII